MSIQTRALFEDAAKQDMLHQFDFTLSLPDDSGEDAPDTPSTYESPITESAFRLWSKAQQSLQPTDNGQVDLLQRIASHANAILADVNQTLSGRSSDTAAGDVNLDTRRLNYLIDQATLEPITPDQDFWALSILFDEAGVLDYGDKRREIVASIDASIAEENKSLPRK